MTTHIDDEELKPTPSEDQIEYGGQRRSTAVERVEDTDAAGYVDPTLVISDEEDKRLRRRIHRRRVDCARCPISR